MTSRKITHSVFTSFSADGIELYRGKSERTSRVAARKSAGEGWIGRVCVVKKDGVRIGAYVTYPNDSKVTELS